MPIAWYSGWTLGVQRNCRVTGHFISNPADTSSTPPGAYQSVGYFLPTATICLWSMATLVDQPPCGCNCASLVTNVVGNLFSVALLRDIKCPLGALAHSAPGGAQDKWAFSSGVWMLQSPSFPESQGATGLDGQCPVSGAESLPPTSMELCL